MDSKNKRILSDYRLNKAREDLEASKLLYNNNLFSQSLNRSYYSIFHTVRALIAYESLDFGKHSAIISYFNKNYINTNKLDRKYSKILMGAEKLRNKSDYNDFFIVAREDAYQQLTNAEEFISIIDKYIDKNLRPLPWIFYWIKVVSRISFYGII